MKRAISVGIGLSAVAAAAVACVGDAQADGPGTGGSWRVQQQEAELGMVRWERDYAVARARAKQAGKPLFVLFQEVPG